MSDSSRKLFNRLKQPGSKHDVINVLVSLKTPADNNCLRELENIGLNVTVSNGNKLVGKISSSRLPSLKNHVQVLEVEPSVKLDPNAIDP